MIFSFVLGIISSHKLRAPTSASRDNSPFIDGQLLNETSETSSLQSSGQFKFDDLPTWTSLSNGSSVTSQMDDASDGEMQVNDDIDSDIDEAVPRKRQKTQTGSNARITISNVLVESPDKKSTIVDKKHKLPSLQNFAMPTVSAVDSEDTRLTRVAISNKETEPSPTTSISSRVQFDSSIPTTVIRTTPAPSQNEPVKEGQEGNSTSTQSPSRKRVNGLSGLLVSRPLAMSKSASTSDSSNSGVLKEPPRKTRGLALRPTNWSYGTKFKKSQGGIADQDELELWTNADVAHIAFRKPDELELLSKVEEESTKRNVSHILTCLMEMEAGGSSENVAENEWTKMVKNLHAVDGLEGQKDEKTRDDLNSPQVPLPQLEDWSTTLRSLLKGKKRFQPQVCCDPSPLSLTF